MGRDYTVQRLKWCETGKKGDTSSLYLALAFVLKLPKEFPNPQIEYDDTGVLITWRSPTHSLCVCTDKRGFTACWATLKLSISYEAPDVVVGWNACLDFVRNKLAKEKGLVNEIP